jgi:hypothetical protein
VAALKTVLFGSADHLGRSLAVTVHSIKFTDNARFANALAAATTYRPMPTIGEEGHVGIETYRCIDSQALRERLAGERWSVGKEFEFLQADSTSGAVASVAYDGAAAVATGRRGKINKSPNGHFPVFLLSLNEANVLLDCHEGRASRGGGGTFPGLRGQRFLSGVASSYARLVGPRMTYSFSPTRTESSSRDKSIRGIWDMAVALQTPETHAVLSVQVNGHPIWHTPRDPTRALLLPLTAGLGMLSTTIAAPGPLPVASSGSRPSLAADTAGITVTATGSVDHLWLWAITELPMAALARYPMVTALSEDLMVQLLASQAVTASVYLDRFTTRLLGSCHPADVLKSFSAFQTSRYSNYDNSSSSGGVAAPWMLLRATAEAANLPRALRSYWANTCDIYDANNRRGKDTGLITNRKCPHSAASRLDCKLPFLLFVWGRGLELDAKAWHQDERVTMIQNR